MFLNPPAICRRIAAIGVCPGNALRRCGQRGLRLAVMSVMALVWLPASAQELPAGVRFGMGVDDLRTVLPTAEVVRRPERLAGGLAGTWRLADTQVAGLAGSQVFYFAAGQLRRVEFQADTGAVPDGGAAAFDRLLAWGRERYGPERPAQDAVARIAGWSDAGQDLYLRLATQPRASLKLVFSARPPRDDRQL